MDKVQLADSCGTRENSCEGEWHGRYPILEGNVLALVRNAVKGEKGFIEKDRGAYISFDYSALGPKQVESMFPDVNTFPKGSVESWRAAVRRECRGLLIDAKTGYVCARRFPKFFNMNELPECTEEEIRQLEGPIFYTEKVKNTMDLCVRRLVWMEFSGGLQNRSYVNR